VGSLRFNPVVSLVAFATIWGIAIWCMSDSDGASANLGLAQDWVAYYFTWL
jgi:hypothetical protein